MEKYSKEIQKEWNDNPKYWRCFGLLYFNKEDERIFPPKRKGTGIGWTVNLANPKSILALVLVTVIVLVCIDFIRKL
jgi:uncharacterized membrane protein